MFYLQDEQSHCNNVYCRIEKILTTLTSIIYRIFVQLINILYCFIKSVYLKRSIS